MQEAVDHIVSWLDEHAEKAGMEGFVVGVSGGIDSALTSTLCALTGRAVVALNMPIHQDAGQLALATEHIAWLCGNYSNVETLTLELSDAFDGIARALPEDTGTLALANARSRLRMLALYAIAQGRRRMVAGTGNRVEDFGVGFFTKYGDGGVDLSPIADLFKSDVYALAGHLGSVEGILGAAPTDGLWDDKRTDEEQMGASYAELEEAMQYGGDGSDLGERQRKVLEIYRGLNARNQHKMRPIPVCVVPRELLLP